MRVSLPDTDREQLFIALIHKGFGRQQIAKLTGVSTRTVFDWKRGKYTIPEQHFNLIIRAANIDCAALKITRIEDWSHTAIAGRLGAAIRAQKYGSLGTPESRRRGGMNSYLARKDSPLDIFTPKSIKHPQKDALLAEFVGILIGDGGVTKYQVIIATNAIDDYEYSLFIVKLINRLFGLKSKVSVRDGTKALSITISSVALVEFLISIGIIKGDKLKHDLDIPTWILKDRDFSLACLRGIFDTDGCIFQERHKIKEKTYCYPRLSFVSMSPYLCGSIYETLFSLDLSPKMRNNRVNLEARKDIDRYFRIIGTSNPKHLERYLRFGGVG